MRVSAVLSACVVLTGCGGSLRGYDGGEPVPIRSVLNQIKCEIAESLVHGDFSKLDLRGWQIVGKLTTNTLISNAVSGSFGTGEGGPAIIPLGARRRSASI